jgi:hypothetical protein
MMMKAAPAAPFKMAEPDFLFELLIIALDAPAQLGQIDKTGEGNVVGKRGEPIFDRLILTLGPFDEEPLLGAAQR